MLKIKSLFSEDMKVLSLGRVSFWIVFGISIYFWFKREPEKFPETLFYSFLFLLLYNVSKKGFDTLNKFFEYRLDEKIGHFKNMLGSKKENEDNNK